MQAEEPRIETLQERVVACLTFTGNFVGKPEVFARLFGALGQWAGPKGLMGPDTVFLSAYQDDFETTAPDDLTLKACMSIPGDTEVEGEIQKETLPGGQYVVMHAELTGPEEYGPVWERAAEWSEKNGCKIDMSRPSYEIYLNDPEEHPEKHHILDVCLSVRPSS